MTIRFPKDLKAKAQKLAEADERSFNTYVVRALRVQVEQDEKKGGGR